MRGGAFGPGALEEGEFGLAGDEDVGGAGEQGGVDAAVRPMDSQIVKARQQVAHVGERVGERLAVVAAKHA